MSLASSENVEKKQTVVPLNEENCFKLMGQFVEVAHSKGIFNFAESDLLKRSVDVCSNGASDSQITKEVGKQLLTNGLEKGQRSGAFSLYDASVIFKVLEFLKNIGSFTQEEQPVSQPQTNSGISMTTQPKVSSPQPSSSFSTADLSELSAPIPLKPREI